MNSFSGYGFLCVSVVGLSWLVTLVLIKYGTQLHLIEQPRADRWHTVPTPNTGGLGILTVCLGVGCMVVPSDHWPVLLCALGAGLLGFVDDRFRLSPRTKLVGQCALAIGAVICGAQFSITSWVWVNACLTILWIVGVTNAFNLIDNMDGLCAGTVVVISAFLFLIAIREGTQSLAVLFLVVGCAYLGFLSWNYHSARVFMGDCGSMFAGFSLSTLALFVPQWRVHTASSGLLLVVLVFAYPLFDTALVSISRRVAGKPVSVGGRDHSSHRLVSLGHSERKSVWILWAISVIGGGAVLLDRFAGVSIYVSGILITLALLLFGLFLAELPGYVLPSNSPVRSRRLLRWVPLLRAWAILFSEGAVAIVAALLLLLASSSGGGYQGAQSDIVLFILLAVGAFISSSIAFRTYRSGWRSYGFGDALRTVCSVLVATLLIRIANGLLMNRFGWQESVAFAGSLFFLSAGMRVLFRGYWLMLGAPRKRQRAAIITNGMETELLVLVVQRLDEIDAAPVVVISSDPIYENRMVYGVPTRYSGGDPFRFLKEYRVEMVILASLEESSVQESLASRCFDEGLSVHALTIALRQVGVAGAGGMSAIPVRCPNAGVRRPAPAELRRQSVR